MTCISERRNSIGMQVLNFSVNFYFYQKLLEIRLANVIFKIILRKAKNKTYSS